MTYNMATNFDCDTETRSEGEDREILAVIKDNMAGLMKSVETMRFVVESKIAKKCLAELEEGLADLWHNSSIAYCVERATEAAGEARVVTVQPMKIANAGMSERLDALSLKQHLDAAE